jgi:hypothetical protein
LLEVSNAKVLLNGDRKLKEEIYPKAYLRILEPNIKKNLKAGQIF